MLHLSDTIAAIATPPGEGGVGIVRVSGPAAFAIADRLFDTRAGLPSTLSTHTIHYGIVRENGERIDDALLLVFRGPRSYTGEDVLELSCHGGPVTLRRVLAAALRAGARLAEPGEFTRRAFLNGRMDLAQAEAVADQIRARTEAAQRVALRQREGFLSAEVRRLKDEVVGALAAVEVTIDFSDEVGDLDYPAMAARLASIRAETERLLATAGRGRVYREGVRLAIVGRPNVGKSSLLNTLLRENRAIVTPVAGTTRDVIEETANVCGIPITAIDTAGLRETEDLVERIGVDRARAAAESASLILFVIDGGEGWTEEDAEIARSLDGRQALWVVNKMDLGGAVAAQNEARNHAGDFAVVGVSALEGSGVAELERAIADAILEGRADAGEGAVVSNVRHQTALESAAASLRHAEETTEAELPADFISIDLRAALDSLGLITGETATEDVIHRIFHDFCIGK
jgi:tRNA modification GTPase